MKTLAFLFVVAVSISSYADSALNARRDQALKQIDACRRRNDASSRECKHLNENVQTLVDVYKSGDKTVLPTLFRFTYLTDFYGEALLSDPDGLLAGIARLHDQDRAAVLNGLTGGAWGLRNRERFEAIRAVLAGIPDSSPVKQISQVCLKTLERNNASFIVTYFPRRHLPVGPLIWRSIGTPAICTHLGRLRFGRRLQAARRRTASLTCRPSLAPVFSP